MYNDAIAGSIPSIMFPIIPGSALAYFAYTLNQTDLWWTRDIGGLTIWEDLMLYSNSTGQEVIAVDRRTRQVEWRAPLTPNSFSGLRPPLVRDGVAYFTDTQGGVFAVDARTGRQRLKTKRPYGYTSHEVCGDIVYGDDILGDVLDRATGRPLGRPLGTDDVMGQAAVADDVLYLSAESGVYAFDCTRP